MLSTTSGSRYTPRHVSRKIIVAAVLTLGPCAANAATVMQSIFRAGNDVDLTNTSVNLTFISYTTWTSVTNPNTMTATLNLGNMLDFDGNGIIDPNETLAPIGTATNAFVGFATNPAISGPPMCPNSA